MEVEKSSAASAESCERLRWISQQGGEERLFNRSLEMLKPKPAKISSAGIKDFNKCAVMADSLWRRPEDTAGDLTVGSMRPETGGSLKPEQVDVKATGDDRVISTEWQQGPGKQ